jgi:hypothetical protein
VRQWRICFWEADLVDGDESDHGGSDGALLRRPWVKERGRVRFLEMLEVDSYREKG